MVGPTRLTTPNCGSIRCRPRARGRFSIRFWAMTTGSSPSKQLLIERTEGNPFFLEESVRTLVETRVLWVSGGIHHLEKKVESTQVPATVQAVLAARIDRLPLEEKQPPTIGRGHRQRCSVLPSCRRSLNYLTRNSVAALPISKGRSSFTRRVCFLIWNTLSSTRSPTKWRTQLLHER